MEILMLILGFCLAYLLGSFSSSVWIGRWFYKTDVRTQGSKNAGATNTIRVLGLKAGTVVLLLDVVKGFLAVFLGSLLFNSDNPEWEIAYELVLGVFAVIGHIFPLYTGFKGGKGVATIVGVLIALYWFIFPFILGLFVVIFLIWRYISLSSIVSAISFPFVYLLFCWIDKEPVAISLFLFSILVAVFIPITHKKNIRRLIKGEEPKFYFKKTV